MTRNRSMPERGRCPYCGRRFALTRDGKVRKHKLSASQTRPYPPVCGGSGHKPTAGSGR